MGNMVSVVRTTDDRTPEITEEDLEKKLSPAEEETQLENLMEHQVDKFMDNHVIRLKMPEGITAALANSHGRSYSIAGNALDISLARMFSIVEGKRENRPYTELEFRHYFWIQSLEMLHHQEFVIWSFHIFRHSFVQNLYNTQILNV